MTETLSQDEIDDLLDADEKKEFDKQEKENEKIDPREPVKFDFNSQDKIIRGRMPTLETINEKFSRYLRLNVFSMMRQSTEISVAGVQMMKFSEYINTLFVPTSLNMVKFRPLKGTALINMDAKLVFLLVDHFFGGDGSSFAKIEGRDFTPVEKRIIHILLKIVFDNYSDAWSSIIDTTFEYLDSEINPTLATIVSPTELVVVNSFSIDLEGGGGELHIVLPYSMLEPIKELLDSSIQHETDDTDLRWSKALYDELLGVDVNLKVKLTDIPSSLQKVMELEVGSVLPIDIPDKATVLIENIPSFLGTVGKSKDKIAIELDQVLPRPKQAKSHIESLNKKGINIADYILEIIESTKD